MHIYLYIYIYIHTYMDIYIYISIFVYIYILYVYPHLYNTYIPGIYFYIYIVFSVFKVRSTEKRNGYKRWTLSMEIYHLFMAGCLGYPGYLGWCSSSSFIFYDSQSLLLMEELLHQLRLVVYPIVYRVLYIPGGAGFQPSTVFNFTSTVLHWQDPMYKIFYT